MGIKKFFFSNSIIIFIYSNRQTVNIQNGIKWVIIEDQGVFWGLKGDKVM